MPEEKVIKIEDIEAENFRKKLQDIGDDIGEDKKITVKKVGGKIESLKTKHTHGNLVVFTGFDEQGHTISIGARLNDKTITVTKKNFLQIYNFVSSLTTNKQQ